MRRNYLVSGLIFVLANPAFAQQPQQPPMEQALAGKLMAEINAGLQCSAGTVGLQQQLAAPQARIKELEKPKSPDRPKMTARLLSWQSARPRPDPSPRQRLPYVRPGAVRCR
jgi:hypothetical protein